MRSQNHTLVNALWKRDRDVWNLNTAQEPKWSVRVWRLGDRLQWGADKRSMQTLT